MLHAKFQDHRTWYWRTFLKVFTIYGHGGHLGYVCYEMDKTSITMFKIFEPGGVSFGPIQHLRGLNSM